MTVLGDDLQRLVSGPIGVCVNEIIQVGELQP